MNVVLILMIYDKSNDATKEKEEYRAVIDLCNQHGIPFINCTYMVGLSDHHGYFHDFVHLNQNGAIEYTQRVCEELKKLTNY